MNRYQKILSGLLILQVVIAAVVFWPRYTVQAAAEPLFSGIDVAEVTAVTITNNDGQVVELAREGDDWLLASSGDYPANSESVNNLLTKLAAARTNRLVTQTEASHNRLQIADDNFNRRIRLSLADGSQRTIYWGSVAGGLNIHMRLAGQDAVYLAGNSTLRDASTTPGDWIDTSYVALPREEITAVTVENENGIFTFTKSGDEEWIYTDLAEGEEFKQARLNTFLSRLTNLNMTEPLSTAVQPEYGLDAPLATVNVTTESEAGTQTYTLQIGAKDEANNTYIVKWSEADYYVRIAGFNASDFVETTREDLLETGEAESNE